MPPAVECEGCGAKWRTAHEPAEPAEMNGLLNEVGFHSGQEKLKSAENHYLMEKASNNFEECDPSQLHKLHNDRYKYFEKTPKKGFESALIINQFDKLDQQYYTVNKPLDLSTFPDCIYNRLPNVSKQIFDLYPYIPGQHGVPFKIAYEIFQKGEPDGEIVKLKSYQNSLRHEDGSYSGIFRSGSGRNLTISCELHKSEMHLIAYDNEHDWYRLQAKAVPYKGDSGYMKFHINTRILPKDKKEFNDDHHPDLWAKKFIKFSIDFFQSFGCNIDELIGDFNLVNDKERDTFPSDNYDMFIKDYLKFKDPIHAALNTWAGKVFALNGFNKIKNVRVSFPDDRGRGCPEGAKIFVRFVKNLDPQDISKQFAPDFDEQLKRLDPSL